MANRQAFINLADSKHNILEALTDKFDTFPITVKVIADKLRFAIQTGALPAGTRLPQHYLATLFGVSRMPIREALRQLEAQKFVDSDRGFGAMVSYDLASPEQAHELRCLLEPYAVNLMTLPTWLEAGTGPWDLAEQLANVDVSEAVQLYVYVFMSIYRAVSSKSLLHTMEAELNASTSLLAERFDSRESRREFGKHFDQLLSCIRLGRMEAAAAVLTAHLAALGANGTHARHAPLE